MLDSNKDRYHVFLIIGGFYVSAGLGILDTHTMECVVFPEPTTLISETLLPLIGPYRSTLVTSVYPDIFRKGQTSVPFYTVASVQSLYDTTTETSTSFPGVLFLTSIEDFQVFCSFI